MHHYPPAILFDLDDTLICYGGITDAAWTACCEDFIQAHRPPFDASALMDAILATQNWYWADPVRHKAGRENLRDARREIVTLALRTLDFEDQALAHALADHYTRTHEEMSYRYPGTRPLLDKLHALGIRLALITNGSAEGQRAKLQRFGLTDDFEHIFIDTETGFSKPDPRAYTLAMQRLNLPAESLWMVGDNLSWDIQGAQAVGIHAVWHDARHTGLPQGSAVVPDRIIDDIAQL